MIPIIGAWKGSSIAWKIGSIVLPIVLAFGAWKAFIWYQQSIGYAKAEAEHFQELLAQQQEVTGQFILQEALKLKGVEQMVKEKDLANARLRAIRQRLLAYESTQQEQANHEPALPILEDEEQACIISPVLVRDVNELGRVLNDTAARRPASTSGTPSEPAL